MHFQKIHEISLIGFKSIVLAIEGLVEIKKELLFIKIPDVKTLQTILCKEIYDGKIILRIRIDDPDQVREKPRAIIDDYLLKRIQNGE